MNPGANSEKLSIAIPQPGLTTAASGLNIGSAVSMGVSAVACALSTVFAPGWDSLACAAGLLRSFSHLQVGRRRGCGVIVLEAYFKPSYRLSSLPFTHILVPTCSWCR